MAKPTIRSVAVVGTGVIGRSWIQVFARARCRVAVYDADAAQLARAMEWFHAELDRLRAEGAIDKDEAKARRKRVRGTKSLAEALEHAGWVQESGPERLEIKRAMYQDLDGLAPPEAIVASSTSALDMTDIARGLPGAARCLVAHPVNPPHVVPVVEVLGGTGTRPEVVDAAVAFLRSIGQAPVLMKKFAPGFVLNRMQAALIREAVDLVRSGVADVEAVDLCIREGLGLRWALMGPFGVANTNADGGVAEYFTRFRPSYHALWDTLRTDLRLDDALVAELTRQTDAMLGPDREALRAWRDRLVMAIRDIKKSLPAPGSRPEKGKRTKKSKAGGRKGRKTKKGRIR